MEFSFNSFDMKISEAWEVFMLGWVSTRKNAPLVFDRLVNECLNRLFMAWWTNKLDKVVGTIMINQQLCSRMIAHVVKEWWNSKIEQRCYNNHERGCCINSGFSCSHIREQSKLIRQVCIQYVETWLNDTLILPIRSCSIMLTVLLHGCWANKLF